jgi:hypothetical protein
MRENATTPVFSPRHLSNLVTETIISWVEDDSTIVKKLQFFGLYAGTLNTETGVIIGYPCWLSIDVSVQYSYVDSLARTFQKL